MNSKLKDILLYSFAAIGVCSLFIAATNTPQQTTSAVPESHVWEAVGAEGNWGWLYNKKTGDVMGLDANRRAKVIVQTLTKR